MSADPPLHALSLTEAAARIAGGSLRPSAYAAWLLARVQGSEPAIGAWAHLDADAVRAEAAARDLVHPTARGALFGMPIGVKDIIATARLPTRYGSAIVDGPQEAVDAQCVRRIDNAGGYVFGKTVTTEFAFMQPGKTRNPWNTAHTPGGSSSGSAAAVAARHVPAAIGSQTNGSIVRPAAFCGVVGFKPTLGAIDTGGALVFSQSLDTLGTFTRTVADAARLASVLAASSVEGAAPDSHVPGNDGGAWGRDGIARGNEGDVGGSGASGPANDDSWTRSGTPRNGSRIAPTIVARARPPRIAFLEGYPWTSVDVEMSAALAACMSRLRIAGADVSVVDLPELLHDAKDVHRTLMLYEAARNLAHLPRSALSAALAGALDEGARIDTDAYRHAQALRMAMRDAASEALAGFDAMASPPAPGAAPASCATTGDPGCCTLWSLLGFPAIALPIGLAANRMPLGMQLASTPDDDDSLLSVAAWVEARLPFRGLP